MVLVIDLALTHGGGQRVLLDFVQVAVRSGNEVTAMVAAGGWIERSLSGAQRVVSVPAPARGNSTLAWRGWRFARFLWSLFQNRAHFHKADLIVVNDPELYLPAVLLATLLQKDTTLYLHMAYTGLAAVVVRFASVFASVTRLVCVSTFVCRHTETNIWKSARRKLVVVENALPRGSEDFESDGPVGDMSRIAIVGRLIPGKGQDVVCALSHQLPDSEFHLVGPFENSDREYVERLRRGSAKNVKLVGYQDPVIRYLRDNRIGIVLVPSRIAEAFSLVPIEATAAGCVVIVRNLGGLAEVAKKAGLTAVDGDGQFYPAIRALQAADAGTLRSRVDGARRQAMIHYHPLCFERGVREAFDWR